jgi:hypothetical protein
MSGWVWFNKKKKKNLNGKYRSLEYYNKREIEGYNTVFVIVNVISPINYFTITRKRRCGCEKLVL